MEKIITTLLMVLTFSTMNAQITVEVKNGQLSINDQVDDHTKILLKHATDASKNKEIKATDYPNIETTDIVFEKSIKYKRVPAEDKIIFWKDGDDEKNAESLFFCADDKKFLKDKLKCSKKQPKPKVAYDLASQIPFPFLQAANGDELINTKRNRYLLLDASANHNQKINNSLFKVKNVSDFNKDNTFLENFERADALPVNGSLTIFVRNYNFHDLEKITIDISGSDYVYNHSIKDILKDISNKVEEAAEGAAATSDKETGKNLTNDLAGILKKLKTYKYLNINDLYVIENYKREVFAFYEKHFKDFTKADVNALSEIIHWYPEYLSITPIAITVPDNDEVTIKVMLKTTNESSGSDMKVGVFKTTGGIGFNLGGMFYITNLKNNSIYTTPGATAGKVNATMNSENQSSVGLGLNSEIYFRTGYLLRPTLNMGFFIPFDEDLTPFGAIGPGISIASKRVKFSFSWGLAVGKVNSIKEEYSKGEFDSTGLTNDQLGEKVWKFGNYFGFGLTYNLPTD